MRAERGELQLVALGPLAPERLEALAAGLSRRLAFAVRPEPPFPAGPLPRLLARDHQLDADALLERLESGAGQGRLRLGITGYDAAIPVFTFVFGRARKGGHAALVSLARLDPAFYGLAPDETLLVERAVSEAAHELGHVAGLAHCAEAACVMRFAGTVEKADARGGAFCPACAARLPDWMRSAAKLR